MKYKYVQYGCVMHLTYENSGQPGVILMLLVLVYSVFFFFKSIFFCTSVLQLCENNSLVYSGPEIILKNYFILTLAYH